jgi:hypothetical protein
VLLDPKRPKVTPIEGEQFRFLVDASKPGEPPYLVDLEARFPLGRCVCKNYECERWPKFKETLYAIPCKHIEAAQIYYALSVVRRRSKNLKGDGE